MSIAVARRSAIEVRDLPQPTVPGAVERCYDVLDLCRGCGITDFTDGKYIDSFNDRTAYLAAQRRQTCYLLDEIDCGPGSRILDIGCGYGRVLAAAAARRAIATGITISPPQAANCRSRSLDARLVNYRLLFADGEHEGWAHAFDGIVANGSLEHFVQCEDAAAGQADALYTEFFEICRRLLKPGGRLATTAIHARSVGAGRRGKFGSGARSLGERQLELSCREPASQFSRMASRAGSAGAVRRGPVRADGGRGWHARLLPHQ